MKRLASFFTVKKFSFKKCLIILFVLTAFPLFAETEVTTITITNARQTTYTKDNKSGNDTIVLEGSVELSVTKGSTSSEIKADKITYDRKTEMLYAEGNVAILTKSSSSGGETTTASALLMNTATLEGAFDDGRIVQTQSDALNLPSGSTLIVFSDIFGKSESNTIAFKDSRLTFCDEEDPHWHIDASRTWLLPGGEFAFLNAWLFVGYVPVLYLPAFYYPKDELVFNPVFAYNKREGFSVQNTIYLYGRKPLSSSSSTSSSSTDTSEAAESLKAIYNFMKPSTLKEQKLEGLMLHNLDEDYTGNTSDYVKLMGDWYSTLGGMVGFEGNLAPAPNYISKLSFNAYLGFSNTIFQNEDNDYILYNPNNGQIYSDSSTFLGITMPFRYSGGLEFGISKPFRFSISLPFYSDPFFAYDFKDNRQETMDWISYLLESSTKDESTVTVSEVSSFTWSLSSSYSPTMPKFIKPYLSSFSTSLNSSLIISSQTADKDALLKSQEEEMDEQWVTYTPSRKFYYPSQITPANFSMSFSGTIFQWPKVQESSSSRSKSFPVALNKPEEMKKPSEIKAEEEEAAKKAEEEAKKLAIEKGELVEEEKTEEVEEESDEIDFEKWIQPVFPDLSFSASTGSLASGLTYKLGYSVSPSLVTQVSYASSNLAVSEDFDWSNIRAFLYTVKIPTSITSNLNYAGSFFGLTNKLSYDPVFQKHPIISLDEAAGGYTTSAKNSLIVADYNAESQNISNSNSVSLYPFTYTEHFADTGVSWDSTIRLYRKKFIGDADNPEWEIYSVDLDDDDCVTVNSVNLKLGTAEFDKKFKQNITLSSVMPPLLRQYTGTLNLTFPYVNASFGTSYSELTHDDDVEQKDKWKLNPLQQSLSVSVLNNKLKFTESFNYNYDLYDEAERKADSFKFTTAWNSLNLSYIMSNTLKYEFDEEEGWKVVLDEEGKEVKDFIPYSLSFSFAPSTKTYYTWFNRISVAPGLNTSIVADLVRSTNSYLLFSPSLSFKITDFFTLTFSSTSRNSVLYRYFQKFFGNDGRIPGEQNPFLDLINSYRFDDISKRKGSGYKLKSLNMTMSHELHDWKFNLTYKVEPKLIYKASTQSYTYDFTPNITVGIVWNPMESIKTNLVYKYDEEEEDGLWALE